MADDPSNGELARRIDDVHQSVLRMVSQELYLAEQRSAERRFGELERAIEKGRQRHDGDMKALNDRIDGQIRAATEHRMSWRQVIWTGLLPALVVLISILVQLWTSGRGGK